MELTEKAKKDFEAWIIKSNTLGKFIDLYVPDFDLGFNRYVDFIELPDSMKFGVIQDWFDSVGIDTDIMVLQFTGGNEYNSYVSQSDLGLFKTRHEARTEAIKQANKIYNEKASKN